jgi:prevent-host-death family protein
MVKTVSATEARVHFGAMLDEVVESGTRIFIERDGKPTAMLISLADGEQLNKRDYDPEELIERARRNRESVAEWRRVHCPGEPFPNTVEEIRTMREERDSELLGRMLGR